MWLGDRAHSHAVLPAFILGLALSSHFEEHRKEQERLRVVAFAFLTPFFFMKGGLNVSLGAVWANIGLLALLFAAKIVPKVFGLYPLARRYTAPHAIFTTLLMSTGLTFGTITSLYGLNIGIIDRTQFSLLIAVVVLSAVVPTYAAGGGGLMPFERILVAIDGSEASDRAFAKALELAELTRASLTAL